MKSRDSSRLASILSRSSNIPSYMRNTPWYMNQNDNVKKQDVQNDNQKKTPFGDWYARGQMSDDVVYKFRKGACENCGAMTHKAKDCVERPRKVQAKFSGKNFSRDEVVKDIKFTWEGKRDLWNGYQPEMYMDRMKEYEDLEKERVKKKMQEAEDKGIEKTDLEEDFKEKLYDAGNAPVIKRDPRIKTYVKNLRLREDISKYLRNLNEDSAYYDGKSRSMRENPNPHLPANQQTFKGDNFSRLTGDTITLLQQERFAWEHADREGIDINSISYPTATEKLYKLYLEKYKNKLKQRDTALKDQYGTQEELEKAGIIFESESYKEFDENGNLLDESDNVARSKYKEDIYPQNHQSVWGSWWSPMLGWGFACCYSTDRYGSCLGEKGKKISLQKEYKLIKELEDDVMKKTEEKKEDEDAKGSEVEDDLQMSHDMDGDINEDSIRSRSRSRSRSQKKYSKKNQEEKIEEQRQKSSCKNWLKIQLP